MKTGDRIKIFPETDKRAYIDSIHNNGFNCIVHHDYIEIGSPSKRQIECNEYAKAIKNARKAKGMTREELAKKLGVHYQTIFNWEIGFSRPNKTNRAELNKIIELEGVENGKI